MSLKRIDTHRVPSSSGLASSTYKLVLFLNDQAEMELAKVTRKGPVLWLFQMSKEHLGYFVFMFIYGTWRTSALRLMGVIVCRVGMSPKDYVMQQPALNQDSSYSHPYSPHLLTLLKHASYYLVTQGDTGMINIMTPSQRRHYSYVCST